MANIMVFEVNDQLFGYDTKFIKESVNIETVFTVPKSPSYLKGIFNLRNNPIPLVDLGKLLWDKSLEADTVIVIEKDKSNIGILIDKLKGVMQIDDDKFFSSENLSSIDSLSKKYIDSYFEKDGEIILMLQLDSLFKSEKISKSTKYQATKKNKDTKKEKSNINKVGYIIFQIRDEWFAVAVNSVQEILSYPENISPIPDNPYWLKGLFLLRDLSVLLIDLPEFLDIEDDKHRERVILVNIYGKLYGIAVPYVKEIKWIEKDEILQIKNDSIKNKGVISLDNNERLVLVLDIVNLLKLNLDEDTNFYNMEEDMNEFQDNEKLVKYLNFKVGSINMAINIKDVQEVVEYHKINTIPKSPDYILGMMNLRNTVITVVSLEKKLGIDDSSISVEDKRIIVLNGKSVSLLVDNLEGILSLKESDIFPPDENVDIEEKYLEGITKLNNEELTFILNIKNLLQKDSKYFNI